MGTPHRRQLNYVQQTHNMHAVPHSQEGTHRHRLETSRQRHERTTHVKENLVYCRACGSERAAIRSTVLLSNTGARMYARTLRVQNAAIHSNVSVASARLHVEAVSGFVTAAWKGSNHLHHCVVVVVVVVVVFGASVGMARRLLPQQQQQRHHEKGFLQVKECCCRSAKYDSPSDSSISTSSSSK